MECAFRRVTAPASSLRTPPACSSVCAGRVQSSKVTTCACSGRASHVAKETVLTGSTADSVKPNAMAHDDPLNIEGCTFRSGLVDFYALLQVDESATPAEMKAAYRALQKRCHPDIMGQERGHQMSVLLNEAYTILSDEHLRTLYDVDLKETLWEQQQGFTNQAFSEWMPHSRPHLARNADPEESRAVFVDEFACIGCKQCLWRAASTFEMEQEFGRARAVRQWADSEDDLHAAVDVCPVQCIHWVGRDDLPVLEHVMQNQLQRVNVGIMRGSSDRSQTVNVFHAASVFQRHERERREAHASWRQTYKYSQEQEEAMMRARARGFNGFVQVARLSAFGKLVAIFAAMSKALRSHFVTDWSESAEQGYPGEYSNEPVPFERALVRVRVDDRK